VILRLTVLVERRLVTDRHRQTRHRHGHRPMHVQSRIDLLTRAGRSSILTLTVDLLTLGSMFLVERDRGPVTGDISTDFVYC